MKVPVRPIPALYKEKEEKKGNGFALSEQTPSKSLTLRDVRLPIYS